MTTKQLMGMDAAMAMLARNAKKDKREGMGFVTIQSEVANWRWIDFVDPINGIPCLGLEWLWGCRGLLCGRMMKIEAEEGTGKSSWLMLSYAMAQKSANAWCVHEESEGTVAPPDFVASFGANPGTIIMPKLQTRSIEAALADIDWTTANIRKDIDPEKLAPIIVGMDSISGFGADDNMEDDNFAASVSAGGLGQHARVVSKWFRDRGFVLEERDVLLMITAQWREKISTGGFSAPGMKKKSTLADRPLNFHATYRMEMYPSPLKDNTGKQIGEVVHFTTTKNKLSPKGKQLEIDLYWDHGFDLQSATCDMLRRLSPWTLPKKDEVFEINQRGAWIECPILDLKANSNPAGKLSMMQALYANKELLNGLRETMRIRGLGFDFEQRYMLTPEEIEDSASKEEEG